MHEMHPVLWDGPHFNTPACVQPVGFGITELKFPIKLTILHQLISSGLR